MACNALGLVVSHATHRHAHAAGWTRQWDCYRCRCSEYCSRKACRRDSEGARLASADRLQRLGWRIMAQCGTRMIARLRLATGLLAWRARTCVARVWDLSGMVAGRRALTGQDTVRQLGLPLAPTGKSHGRRTAGAGQRHCEWARIARARVAGRLAFMVLALRLAPTRFLTRWAVAARAALTATGVATALPRSLTAPLAQQRLGARHALLRLPAAAQLIHLLHARVTVALMAAADTAVETAWQQSTARVAARGHVLGAGQLAHILAARASPSLGARAFAAASRVAHLLASVVAARQRLAAHFLTLPDLTARHSLCGRPTHTALGDLQLTRSAVT